MKTIKSKIARIIVITIIVVALILSIVAAVGMEKSTIGAIEKNLIETAKVADIAASNTIASYTYAVGEIATNAILSDETVSLPEKKEFLDSRVSAYYMRSAGYANTDGTDLFSGENVSNEAYFKAAMSGKTYMSTPYISADKKDMHLVVSAPIKQGEEIVAVVYFICDANILTGIVEGVSVGSNGTAYILDKYGRTIAYTDNQLVLDSENIIEAAKRDPQNAYYAELAVIEQKMVSGETGVGRYSENGDDSIQSYTPIKGSDGWSIAVTASADEFFLPAKRAIIIQIVVSLVLCILGIFIAKKIGASIAAPITACANRLQLMAEGDLQSPVPISKANNETKILSESMETAVSTINLYIKDIDRTMNEMANGNFNVTLSQHFIGDFKAIEDSIAKFLITICHTLRQLDMTADQVSNGSMQVSDGAQLLAQGATEQASAVEELAASINLISNNVQENVKNTKIAEEMAYGAATAVTTSNAHMQKLIDAMAEINTKSVEISKITKTIEDIAFQTNILALNAAVEAARAKEAGKGFAVVADEVRDLAGKSAEAAKNTTELIDASVHAINFGVKLAMETAEDMLGIVGGARATTDAITKIAQATDEQATSLLQVTIGIDQISSVVQINSATSEESAATSEELSGQAHFMKELIDKFQLVDDTLLK